jgi:lysine 2,3-aminomutase
MSDNEIDAAVQYINDNKLEEILISGGDPFVAPVILSKFCGALIENCPSLKIYRIATRTITQSPETIPERVFILLESLSKKVRVEVATQINSAFEFDEETDKVIRRIQSYGITIYSQNVFLRGVNDTPEQLIELYHQMRLRGIEAHYLFHADPIANTHHLRPSVRKMIECYSKLVNSGQVTGRSKPMCAIMSAIGKIILLPDNLLGYVNGYVHLKSRYTLEDRLKYNPNWKMPEEAWVSDDGYLCIEYLDGKD